METRPETGTRDPWLVAGMGALVVLTLLAVSLYRLQPQSVRQASTEGWLAARPNAVAPQLARARERLRFGREQVAAGNDSAALAADSVAAEAAWRARDLSDEPASQAEGTALWGEAMLARAEILRRMGRGAGLRPDDNETLRRALAAVERVLTVPVPAAQRARAEAMRDELTRELRRGPMEWLPSPR